MTLNATRTVVHDPEPSCCDREEIFTTDRGEMVCRNCGSCHGYTMVNEVKRAYTPEEVKQRRTHEPVTYPFGSRTLFHVRKDWTGKKLSPTRRATFYRLQKINRSTIGSVERNYMEALPYTKKRASVLGVQRVVMELAWKIYINAQKQRVVIGRSIRATVSASLYVACRVHDLPRSLVEFLDDDFSRKEFHKATQLVVRKVLKPMGLQISPIDPVHLVYRIAKSIPVKMSVAKRASDLIKKVMQRGFSNCGKDPKGTAGAALYVAGIQCRDHRTQKEISKACDITEVTLRNRLKEIESIMPGLSRHRWRS